MNTAYEVCHSYPRYLYMPAGVKVGLAHTIRKSIYECRKLNADVRIFLIHHSYSQ